MREIRIAAAIAGLLVLSVIGAAQPQAKQTTPKKTVGKNLGNKERSRKKEGESISQKAADPPAYAAEIRRIVKGDESPVLHLGMAPSGATVIEFPASDHYFGVHTSDIGDWVRVEKSPTSRIDSHLVLRPGKDLEKGESAGIVQVQMRSGLTVTLCIHPVKSAASHTNLAVIIYDRDVIVAARRAAGLAVNLGDEKEPQPVVAAAPPPPPAVVEEKPPLPAPPVATAEGAVNEKKTDPKLTEALKKALKEAMSNPGSSFKVWWGPTHGLSVSAKMRSLDENTSIALVAVKNVENTPIQILSDHPELVIETSNKGKVIQLKSLEKLAEQATTQSNIIPGYSTVYYAVAFAPPILGKHQKVRVTVGQRNAADDPAAGNLIGGVK